MSIFGLIWNKIIVCSTLAEKSILFCKVYRRIRLPYGRRLFPSAELGRTDHLEEASLYKILIT